MQGYAKPSSYSRKAVIAAAMVVILLASSLGLAFMGGSDISSADPQEITYNANNGTGASYEVEYSGIASSEYNPEYWEGTVDGVSVENWKGASTSAALSSVPITIGVTSIRVSSTTPTVFYLDGPFSYSLSSSSLTYSYRSWNRTYTQVDNNAVSITENNKVSITPSRTGTGTGSATINLTLSGSVSVEKVFAGWRDEAAGKDYLPGDVVPSSVGTLSAQWVTPDIFVTDSYTSVSVPNGGGSSYHLNMAWSVGLPMKMSNNLLSPYTPNLYSEYAVVYGDGRTAPSMYGTLYWLSSGTAYNVNGVMLTSGTYRSANLSSLATLNTQSGACTLGGDAVIDNAILRAASAGTDHGDGSNGIVANGKILIMGTGLKGVANSTAVSSTNPVGPQVIGGSVSATLSSNIRSKEMVFGTTDIDGNEKTLTVSTATCVIIHSGVYYAVIAGSVGRDIGSSANSLSTYLVMKGGTVLDTLVGGNGSSGVIYAAGQSSSDSDEEMQGGTFVYMLGADLPGDDYEDSASGYYNYRADRGSYVLRESSILEGGSSNTRIWGSTHVFLSGDTTVFDVQAGGRRGSSEVNFTYLEITGDAVVRHIACGTITDGNDKGNNNAHGVRVAVDGNAKVATLCGGGYDTWSAPNSPSMMGGTVDVEMYGGIVGYVYGGGFRGSLGTATTPVAVNVHIIGGDGGARRVRRRKGWHREDTAQHQWVVLLGGWRVQGLRREVLHLRQCERHGR